MTTAVLYPYPVYTIGQVIVVPLAFHAAFCIFFSATIFPCTVTSQYTQTISGVLAPLNDFLAQHRAVLALDPASDEFKNTVTSLNAALSKSDGGLGQAGATSRLLKQDIVYGRFSPTSIGNLQFQIRRLVTRANGMDIFFTLIDPTRERFPVTPVPSRPSSPRSGTPRSSAPSTPLPASPPNGLVTPPSGLREEPDQFARRRRHLQLQALDRTRSHRSLSRYLHTKLAHHQEDHHDHTLHLSLLALAHALAPARAPAFLSPAETAPVGVFESQRYMAIEATRLTDRHAEEYTAQAVALLHVSCDGLLQNTQGVLRGVQDWFAGVRRASFGSGKKVRALRAERLAHLEQLSADAKEAMAKFKKDTRWVMHHISRKCVC